MVEWWKGGHEGGGGNAGMGGYQAADGKKRIRGLTVNMVGI